MPSNRRNQPPRNNVALVRRSTPSRTAFMDRRTKRVYTGKRQPHVSRLKKFGIVRSHQTPGPGAYNPRETKSTKSPRFSFGKAAQRVEEKKDDEEINPWEQAGMGRSLLASSMGYQPTSTARSAPSVSFGTASRTQAMEASLPAAFANARFGHESPGPVYYPQPGRRELEKRFGIRLPVTKANQTSLAREVNSKTEGLNRPSTASMRTSSMSSSISPRRPTTSFGLSQRPPLFQGELGTPGPGAYVLDSMSPRRPSTTPGRSFAKERGQSPRRTTFGNSTRAQEQKIVAVAGSSSYGKDSPGPGAYFPTQEVLDTCEYATRRMGPRFSVGATTSFGSMFESTDRMQSKQQRTESLLVHGFVEPEEALTLSKREPGPCTYQTPSAISTMFKKRVGNMKSAPTVSFTMTPRFGEIASLLPKAH
jgi:hypothetical protein